MWIVSNSEQVLNTHPYGSLRYIVHINHSICSICAHKYHTKCAWLVALDSDVNIKKEKLFSVTLPRSEGFSCLPIITENQIRLTQCKVKLVGSRQQKAVGFWAEASGGAWPSLPCLVSVSFKFLIQLTFGKRQRFHSVTFMSLCGTSQSLSYRRALSIHAIVQLTRV